MIPLSPRRFAGKPGISMPIAGDHPESGVRFSLERPLRGGPPWVYAGHAVTPHDRLPVEVTISAAGEVAVVLGSEVPPELSAPHLSERVRLLFRSLYKQAKEAGTEPPRKVVRWRAERT
jgi:hypothetical protein